MTQVPLIIDTDPGVDDLLAILLALASPEVSLEGITLTFGNTTLDYAHGNILRLSHALNVTCKDGAIANETLRERIEHGMNGKPIPVALGAEKPMGGRLFTASYFHGRDGMSGVSFLEGNPYPMADSNPLFDAKPIAAPADEFILDVIRRHPPHTVRIAAVAPLTNLANAYLKDPETFSKVGCISVMGGALDVPGNTSPTGEFNFFADPWAAKVLLEDATLDGRRLPIHLLPLDTTTRHTVPYSHIMMDESSELYKKNYLFRLITHFLRKPRSVTNSFAPPNVPFDPAKYDLFEAHDPLAVAHAIFYTDAELWGDTERPFLVETDGRHTRGFCVVDRRQQGEEYDGRNKAEVEAERGPKNEYGLSSSSTTPAKRKADDKPVTPPVPTTRVVTKTPGSAWFEHLMLGRLGMQT